MKNAFGTEERVKKKDDVVLTTKFERMSGPFLLGKLAQTQKRTASKVKTHLYAKDPETVWHSITVFTALVERRNLIGIVGDVQFTDEDLHIDLDQDQCEEFLERIRGVGASETDEEDFEQKHDPRVRRTSSGGNFTRWFLLKARP